MSKWNEQEKESLRIKILQAKVTGDLAWYKNNVVPKIVKNKERYRLVAEEIGIPLAMVPLIHCQESGSDLGVFKAYLGNGQPINKVTTIVPKGRGPWKTWEEGAIDALTYDGLNKIGLENWSLERMLFELEGFNGYGYRGKGVNSPYIWNFTNLYSKGRYVADGKYDPNAVSKNIGCFALYKLLVDADRDFAIDDEIGKPNPIDLVPQEPATPSWFEPFKKFIQALIDKVFGIKPPPLALPDATGGNVLETILSKNKNISARALSAALKHVAKNYGPVKNKKYLYLVDMDKYDYELRAHIINMQDFTSRSELVAHGKNSDKNKDNKPDSFSNVSGSGESSLGAMVFAENYVSGKKKTGLNSAFQVSRRIDGLEPKLNGNVRARAVVFHDGFYVTPERAKSKSIGDSLGCFVMYYPVIKELNPLLEGCLLYCYHSSLDD